MKLLQKDLAEKSQDFLTNGAFDMEKIIMLYSYLLLIVTLKSSLCYIKGKFTAHERKC